MKRRAVVVSLLALTAALLAACGQLLGIADVHDDPAGVLPDGGSPPPDASAGNDATTTDATVPEATVPDVPVAPTDGGDAADTGPILDPARGCTGPDGGPASFFTAVSTFPLGLAIDHGGIYVSDSNNVRRCSLEGCDSGVTLVYPSRVNALAADDAHVVVCANGSVSITDSTGTPIKSFVASAGCDALVTRGSDVYWSTNGAIVHAVDDPDGAIGAVVVDPYGIPVRLAPTSQWMFFLDLAQADASTARVARCDLGGCDAGIAVFGTANAVNQFQVATIAANEETVFWGDPSTEQILSCPASGCGAGGPSVVFADASVNGLYADESALYWSTSVSASSTLGGVFKTPLDGGATVMLAASQRGPTHLVVNAACVYWTDNGFVPANEPGAVWGARQP